uniref:Large ribosomal subunit protein uL22c n=1 Tax=Nitzschia alba TaxID=2858 RepID=A0A5C0F3N6_NITAL|nr:50S ribosomal protein L22 [Nitzschia alba]QEI59571.1 50S ribosomal protein L22 [Nitzschia alba]
MMTQQYYKAIIKYVKMSPLKIRRVINQIRGCSYENALMIIRFLPYRATKPIWKLINSAVANAVYQKKLDKKKLFITQIFVNEGPKLKKLRFRAKGKTNKVLKPTSHITIALKEQI